MSCLQVVIVTPRLNCLNLRCHPYRCSLELRDALAIEAADFVVGDNGELHQIALFV